MLNRRHGRLEFALVKCFVRPSEMLHQEAKRNLLGNFERTLDFVHCLDPSRTVGRGDIDRRRTGSAKFIIGEQGRMHRVQRNSAGLESKSQRLNSSHGYSTYAVLCLV